MTASPFAPIVRIALLLAIGAITAPICGAAQRAPEARSTPASGHADGVARTAWIQTATLGETAFPLMAQLGTGTMIDATPLLLAARTSDPLSTSFSPPAVQAARRDDTAMGLQLPEPGPVSAIIATIALAAFFFVRRAS